MSNQQLPPHSAESEKAVLGALLIDPDALHMVSDFLSQRTFTLASMGLFIGTSWT